MKKHETAWEGNIPFLTTASFTFSEDLVRADHDYIRKLEAQVAQLNESCRCKQVSADTWSACPYHLEHQSDAPFTGKMAL